MKIRITTFSIVIFLTSFSAIGVKAQQLQLSRVIDTILSISTTNTTGNDLWTDMSQKTFQSGVLEVPKGKIWVINMSQASNYPSQHKGVASFYVSKINNSSNTAGYGRLVVDDGGPLFKSQYGLIGKATLKSGTKLSIEISHGLPTYYKYYYHAGSDDQTKVLYQYLFSITEYEIVP